MVSLKLTVRGLLHRSEPKIVKYCVLMCYEVHTNVKTYKTCTNLRHHLHRTKLGEALMGPEES